MPVDDKCGLPTKRSENFCKRFGETRIIDADQLMGSTGWVGERTQ